jgi:hypothetical protein
VKKTFKAPSKGSKVLVNQLDEMDEEDIEQNKKKLLDPKYL